MDTMIERKPGMKRKHYYAVAGAVVLVGLVFYFIFRDTSSSMNVEKDRLTIATVTRGEFSDYIRVIGQVMPNRIIYMDAIEGGRVEERLKEEGAMVKAGDVILRLSNPLLNIGIMQSEADLAYQENELRNTRISMEQERLQLKQERIGLNKELIGKQRRHDVVVLLVVDGDEQVAFAHRSLAQHGEGRRVALDGDHVGQTAHLGEQLLVAVDDGDVVAVAAEHTGQVTAHLAGTRYHDFHSCVCLVSTIRRPEGPGNIFAIYLTNVYICDRKPKFRDVKIPY